MADTSMSIKQILAASQREAALYEWKGTFADYLAMVVENPSIVKLAHAGGREAMLAKGVDTSPTGEPIYRLFENDIFGLEDVLARIVEYFEAAAKGTETRKRILLLLGPPAGGKSTIVALIKSALEDYTRTDEGAVYALAGCPMQEEPLHLIPHSLRPVLKEQYGIEIEGEMNPRNRHLLRTKYNGNIAEMPVERVVFSEHEAVGIGYYVATNPNADSTLLSGSVDTSRLEGSRTEVAGKAFRMDGEFNVANRGLIELVEMFKADRHLLTTLLGLAQEQVIKMEKFGSIYADEVIIGHSNEGDFNTFAEDEHSEALKDRITAVQVPYNLRVSEDVKIYEKVMAKHQDTGICIAPLSTPVAATYAVLSRLQPPSRQGMTLLDKMRLYDGRMVGPYTRQDVVEMKHDNVGEGMRGISPRYVMNRIAAVASAPGVKCVTPLAVLDSLWRGITENVSLDQAGRAASIHLIVDTVSEYNQLAISEIQRAYQDSFDDSAELMLAGYLRNVRTFCSGKASDDDYNEQEMQEMERAIGIRDRDKAAFRREVDSLAALYARRERRFTYTADPRLKAAIEARLFPSVRALTTALARPRLKRLREEWTYRRILMVRRLMDKYDYCGICAEDTLEYVTQLLQKRTMLKTTKKAEVSWQWDLYPKSEALSQALSPRSASA
ncbi:MAG: protein prkA [Chloroflexota bacterium]|nr:protein prkA [Chloroflexota bacterium]